MKLFLLAGSTSAAAVAGALGQPPFDSLGNLTATAILGWYAWHTASRSIPEMLAVFRGELAAERDVHRAGIEALRQELSADRDARHRDHALLVQALDRLLDRIPT